VPVVPLKEIVDRAFAERYGVAAINVVNDLTMEAVLAAAVEQRAPVIIQTSVKTVRSIGLDLGYCLFGVLYAGVGPLAAAALAATAAGPYLQHLTGAQLQRLTIPAQLAVLLIATDFAQRHPRTGRSGS